MFKVDRIKLLIINYIGFRIRIIGGFVQEEGRDFDEIDYFEC